MTPLAAMEISTESSDRFHTVVEGDRIELLALEYFGDMKLWWVIADYNDIFFCQALKSGSTLRIPSQIPAEGLKNRLNNKGACNGKRCQSCRGRHIVPRHKDLWRADEYQEN